MTLVCLREGCSEDAVGNDLTGRPACRRDMAHTALSVLADIAQSPRGRQAVTEVRDWLATLEVELAVALEKIEIGSRTTRELADLAQELRSLDKVLR